MNWLHNTTEFGACRTVATLALFIAFWVLSGSWWGFWRAAFAAVLVENTIVFIQSKYVR